MEQFIALSSVVILVCSGYGVVALCCGWEHAYKLLSTTVFANIHGAHT